MADEPRQRPVQADAADTRDSNDDVAALRAQLEALERQLGVQRQLIAQASCGHVRFDGGGRIVEANGALARLLDQALDALIGASFEPLLADAHSREALSRVLACREEPVVELITLRRPGGHLVAAHLHAVRAGEDAVECLVREDVAQGDVARREALEIVLHTIADGVVTTDGRGRILGFNPAAERLFGYSADEVFGQNVALLMPPPYKSAHDSYIQRYVQTGEARVLGGLTSEVEGLRKDGTRMPLTLALGEWWSDGQRRFTAILHDLTAHHVAQERIRESEERFRQIAEHVTDAFFIFDRAEPRLIYASPAFEQIWGRPVAELYTSVTSWVAWLAPEDRDRIVAAYQRYLQGDDFDEEFWILRADGERRRLHHRVFPIRLEGAVVARDVAVAQDITERHALEQELRQAQKMEAIGVLASGIAHDINNVLQGILGCTALALRDGVTSDKVRDYVQRAADAARRGGELPRQLLGFARKRRATARPTHLDQLLEDTALLVQQLVTQQIPVDLALDAPDCFVLADPVDVEHIVMNLTANARDAMPDGGRLTIGTSVPELGATELSLRRLAPAPRYVQLSVADTGSGISARDQERIFEPFFTTKEQGHGTGLGLSTVFAMVEQLGGHIEVHSAEGAGATFIITLPCAAPEQALPTANAKVEGPLRGTVLLVDGHDTVRLTVREQLETLGLDVLDAARAEDAVRLCEDHEGRIDLVITDTVLPATTGAAMAARVRRIHPEARVLYVTGRAIASHETKHPVLHKPFSAEALAEAVHAAILRT